MTSITRRLFFVFGLCLPFFAVGPQIARGLYASPSILIGLLIVGIAVLARGLTLRFLLLGGMLVLFALTSLGRHSPGTYVFSLIMLLAVMAPMCLARITHRQKQALQKGFILGLCATIVLVWIEIAAQIAGFRALYETVGNVFRPVRDRAGGHNFFFLYQRPYAAFLEPAHLSIYLSLSLLVLDTIRTRMAERLRAFTILTILFVGSVVGYVLLLGYLGTKLVGPLKRFTLHVRRRTMQGIMLSAGLVALGIMALVIFQSEAAAGMFDRVFGRFIRTFGAVQSGTLTGSEGSRANMFRVLLDYWHIEGARGLLFGTGYGNSSEWLIANYGHLDRWATVARGQLDSILVAIFLSTGIFGGFFYLYFTATCLKRVGRERFPAVFFMFLLLNFASGFLIAYPIWHLLATVIFLSPRQEAPFHSAGMVLSPNMREGAKWPAS